MMGAMVPENPPLRIDWLKLGAAPLLHTPGRVGLSTCPGRPACDAQLEVDLAVMKAARVTTVLTLVDEPEQARYGVRTLAAGLLAAGVRQMVFPLVDGHPPLDVEVTRPVCLEVLRRLGEGENVLIHCIGGWGRSGTLAAALLTHEGLSGQRAIELVRRARSPRCIETMAQEVFVHRYARRQADFQRLYHFVLAQDAARRLGGEVGARRFLGGEGVLAMDVPVDRLPRALVQVHHLAKGVGIIAFSGEVPIAGAPAEERSLDRAHRVAENGLLPIPFAAI